MKEKGLWVLLVFILFLSSVFGYMTQYHGMNYLFTYTFPLARLPEFLSGMVAALLTFKYNFRLNYWLGLGIVFLSCLYIVYFSPSFNGFAIHNIFILPGVLAFMNLLLTYFKWIGSPIMVYLGKISYGFYILQIPLTYIMYTLLQNKVILPTNYYTGLLLFAADLSLAILMFEYIEKPVHLSLQRRFTQSRLSFKN